MRFLREYRQGFSLAKALLFFIIPWILKTRVERCRLLKNFISKSIMLTINIIDSVLSILLWVYCLKE